MNKMPADRVLRRSLWTRLRIQLGLGLLITVIIPYFIRFEIERNSARISTDTSLHASLLGTALAFFGGWYGYKKMSLYPGVKGSRYVFPAFAITFSIVLTIFFMARIDYSRFHFLASFILSIIWFMIVSLNLPSTGQRALGIVPFGRVDGLFNIENAVWIRLEAGTRNSVPVDTIVADLHADLPDDWERFLADRALNGTMVLHSKQVEESLTGQVSIEHMSENNLGSIIPGIFYARVKRLGDLAVSIILLPLLLPLLAAVAIAIRIDSKGPALYWQQRMGYRGKPFTMLKFRTMVQRADEVDMRTSAMTIDGDPRITRIGRFLRHSRIDELPQIFNIIRGEMSWIGPRPEATSLSEWYEKELAFYRYRHIVRPGITGWAQVKQGHVAEVEEVDAKLKYDFYYIRNFAFWLDLLIIANTVRTVLTGFGAR